jgi:hypothetical protein
MTNYEYDPEFPFILVGKLSGKIYSKFHIETDAMRAADTTHDVKLIDTTPKPKIPADAKFITFLNSANDPTMFTRVPGEDLFVWWDGGDAYSEDQVLEWLGEGEVTVLVPKEDA